MDLGTFSVEVMVQENGLYDVWIAHEGCSGEHYVDITAERIGKLLADDIDCIRDGYMEEFGDQSNV